MKLLSFISDEKAKKSKAVLDSQRQKEITKGINKAIEAELVGKVISESVL